MVEQIEMLKYKTDGLIAKGRECGVGQSAQILALNRGRTGIVAIETAYDIEKRCFAGTARPHNRDKLTLVDLERDVAKREFCVCTGWVLFTDVRELDHSTYLIR